MTDDRKFEIHDDTNQQRILTVWEDGRVEVPNGNLTFDGDREYLGQTQTVECDIGVTFRMYGVWPG